MKIRNLLAGIFIISLLAFAFRKGDNGITIGKKVEFIQQELFLPDTAVFKIVDINNATVTFYYELTENQNGANWVGQTVRRGNAFVPKQFVDALKLSYDGTVTDTVALRQLFAAFNLRIVQ